MWEKDDGSDGTNNREISSFPVARDHKFNSVREEVASHPQPQREQHQNCRFNNARIYCCKPLYKPTGLAVNGRTMKVYVTRVHSYTL